MVAINIRGTGGSGKSYIIHKLLDNYKHKRIVVKSDGKRKPRIIAYHIPEFDLYVIGKYDLLCGGCDTIKGTELTVKRIEKYAAKGNVLYEGYLVSNTWSTYRDLSNRLDKPLWLSLDTPLDVCLDRVTKRRRARGNLKPLNPTNIIAKYNICMKHIIQCEREKKIRHEILNYKESYKQFIQILKRETHARKD